MTENSKRKASILDSIPTPSAADMADLRQFARRYTLVFLRKGPASRDDETRNENLQLGHLQHLASLLRLARKRTR